MHEDILINWSPQETRVAVVANGAVQELHVERTCERGLVGNIYLGKVTRVLPGMQSAFIDMGLEKAAFLHVADVWHPHVSTEVSAPQGVANSPTAPTASQVPTALIPIEKQIFEGQTLLVQVIKDAIGTKGARLTTQISIAGRLLVFLPQDDHIGVSQKIPSELRLNLRQRLQTLVEAASEKDKFGGGFILRTNGEEATDQELGDDIAYLRKTWRRR
jgi:ribonuclease G